MLCQMVFQNLWPQKKGFCGQIKPSIIENYVALSAFETYILGIKCFDYMCARKETLQLFKVET